LGVVAWFWIKPLRTPTSLSFTVGTEQAHGELGAYVAPIGERELPLGFSDGSTIELQPAARARVTRTAANGASLILETGRASFEVVHREGNDWNVAAGPYTVHVTGTSFNVAWDPNTSQVQVAVRRGAVIVRGPGAESGVEVRTSQRFVSSAVARVEEHADAAVNEAPAAPASPININELPVDPASANTGSSAGAVTGRAPS
jgi:ferric-dicitrate binding protein FerR (iron transport regulator)